MLLMMLKKGNHAFRNDYEIQTLKFIKWHYYIVYLFHIRMRCMLKKPNFKQVCGKHRIS